MIIGENYKERFNLTGRYEGEWVELRVPDLSIVKIEKTGAEASIYQIKAILSGWSFTDKNGSPVPITAANIERAPVDWFNQVGELIQNFLPKTDKKPE